ncbi:MAG: serine/threonine protein kinase [Polyangiaceae bacterium]
MDPETIQLKVGDFVDRYLLLRQISAGGGGRVFEARHAYLDRVVALKVMHLHDANRPGVRERMQTEAHVLSRIKHSNVVRVHDAGVHGALFWLAMDLLRGRDLRQLLISNRGEGVKVAEALNYAAEIADGVDAAHEIGVVHRDLKPENVFVTEANEVKVLDLGTAKFYGYGLKTTDKFRVPGTLPYMSPEHCEGQVVDARTDIYALGIMLYEMLSGRHPFIDPMDEPGPHELLSRHLVAEPAPLTDVMPGLPAYIWRVVERALRKNREERYRNMREFATELRDARHRAINAARKYVSGAEANAGFGPRGTFKMQDASLFKPSVEADTPVEVPGRSKASVPQPVAPEEPVTPHALASEPTPEPGGLAPKRAILIGGCVGLIVVGLVIGVRKVVYGAGAPASAVVEAPASVASAPSPASSIEKPARGAPEYEPSEAEIDAVVKQLAEDQPASTPAASTPPAGGERADETSRSTPTPTPAKRPQGTKASRAAAKADKKWETWLPSGDGPEVGSGL